jgi:hypothetical protein
LAEGGAELAVVMVADPTHSVKERITAALDGAAPVPLHTIGNS